MTPHKLAENISRAIPGWREMYAVFLEEKGSIDFADWPDWCYCPVAAALAAIDVDRAPPGAWDFVGPTAAIAAWEATKVTYRFASEILDALWDTPVEKIPVESIYRLPVWCPYIPTPGKTFRGQPIDGFLSHLEYDIKTHRAELRFVLMSGGYMPVSLIVHIPENGNLEDGFRAFLDEALKYDLATPESRDELLDMRNQAREAVADIAPLVSLVLYLCSDSPDVSAKPAKPANLVRKAKKTGKIYPVTIANQVIETGFNLAKTIRAVGASTAEHAGVRPHIRRAHWHTYHTGPKSAPVPVIRWLSPFLVGGSTLNHETIRKISPNS